MAYYAKISNDEFTVSESARLMEAQSEKGVIEANNRSSEEYATLKTAYTPPKHTQHLSLIHISEPTRPY